MHGKAMIELGWWQSVLLTAISNFPSGVMYHPDDTILIVIYCCISSRWYIASGWYKAISSASSGSYIVSDGKLLISVNSTDCNVEMLYLWDKCEWYSFPFLRSHMSLNIAPTSKRMKSRLHSNCREFEAISKPRFNLLNSNVSKRSYEGEYESFKVLSQVVQKMITDSRN